jgi:hypothetical protein
MFVSVLFLSNCSTISKEDCNKDMYQFGLSQGKSGSQKKYTDEIIEKCMAINPAVKPDDYEKGFQTGWADFCTLRNAFELGKKDDKYISFCPAEKEDQFRERFHLGKTFHDLKSTEEELLDELSDYPSPVPTEDVVEYRNTKSELDKIKKKILEI